MSLLLYSTVTRDDDAICPGANFGGTVALAARLPPPLRPHRQYLNPRDLQPDVCEGGASMPSASWSSLICCIVAMESSELCVLPPLRLPAMRRERRQRLLIAGYIGDNRVVRCAAKDRRRRSQRERPQL